jgi:trk system potassium uptake protein TrkA
MNGKSLKDLDPRARHGCSIVAINKQGGVIIAPNAGDVLAEKDVMVIIGTNKQIEQFEHELVNG